MSKTTMRKVIFKGFFFIGALVCGLLLLLAGCDLQTGNEITDGEVLNVKATVTVKDQASGSSIKNATVRIEPSVYIDGATVQIDSGNAQSDLAGTAIVQTDERISTPAEDINGKVPKISVTVTHDDYESGSAVIYGSGFSLDENDGEYDSSASTMIKLTEKEEVEE